MLDMKAEQGMLDKTITIGKSKKFFTMLFFSSCKPLKGASCTEFLGVKE